MGLNTVAFLGSPRKRGNTERLLDAALEGVRAEGGDASIFRLSELNIHPCRNCGGCAKTGKCVVLDDDMAAIYEKIRSADRIILASPIYFFSVSAQTKIMIDRCQAFWSGKYLLKRPLPSGPFGRKGLLLLVGAYRKDPSGLRCAETCGVSFFHSVNISDHRTVAVLGPDGLGAIRDYPESLAEAVEAGKWLAGAKEGQHSR